jgi:cell division septal protein FtsQ
MVAFKKQITLSFFVIAIALLVFCIYETVHSPLFTVQIVEVSDHLDAPPVDAKTITDLAAVPIGKVNLFGLDLRSIEARILAHPWIREVKLQKKFPQTLSINVIFRKAAAIAQLENGTLTYVDENGKFFDTVNLMIENDLPLLVGFTSASDNINQVHEALRLVSMWDSTSFIPKVSISTILWEKTRGFRVQAAAPTGRAMIDLGQEIDGRVEPQLQQLKHVFSYLQKNSIPVHQIWADAGKKIVVKTARGS